jgi:hypothetical protein
MKNAPLIFPDKILSQHLVVLGKTGAGKSSALRHVVEHLLSRKKRVCVVDPKGDWWGLKSSSDGKGAGFPVIMFGDFKEPKAADVPVNEFSGRHVAELIASGNRPAVVGFRGWQTGRMVKFWIDFASTVFNSNAGELYLVVDEVHHFAPKGKIHDPQAGLCLHWTNRLMNEGRGIGLVNLIASQRPQKVHNDTLTACETLVAMRVIHKADRDAVEDWIKGCGDQALGREVLNSLAGMSRGEAFVWSPEEQFGPERLAFPMFSTFDSFAPPQLQRKVSEKDWAGVDLTEVRAKLAAVIEEAKANDPKELQRENARLAKELAAARKNLPRAVAEAATRVETKIERVEVPVFSEKIIGEFKEVIGHVEGWIDMARELANRVEGAVEDARQLVASQTPTTVQKRTPDPARPLKTHAPAKLAAGDVHSHFLNRKQQAILDTLATLEAIGLSEPPRSVVAIWTDQSPTSSSTAHNYGYLTNSKGIHPHPPLIKYLSDDRVTLTDDGRRYARAAETPPTLHEYQQMWIERVNKKQGALLRLLIEAYPRARRREELAAETDQSFTSSSFVHNLGFLRNSLGLADYPDSETAVATKRLFPEGLA